MRILIALLLTAAFCSGQKVASVRAGTIYHSERPVTLDGVEVDPRGQTRLPQVEDGQTLGAPRGHAEILMGPGAILWMRTGSRVRFEDTRLTVGHVTLLEGSVLIEIKQSERDRLITVGVGGQDFSLAKEGLFQFDAEPWRVRSHKGEMVMARSADIIGRGRQASTQGTASFEREPGGEFFHWAAYRSLVLEKESGQLHQWKRDGESAKSEGFGVTYPWAQNAAFIKYLASSEAGMIYRITEAVELSQQETAGAMRLPIAIGQGNFLFAKDGRAEVFLGIGVVARLNRGAKLHILNANPESPEIRIEEGIAIVEVGESNEAPQLRVRTAESSTELRKRGVYEFDAERGVLSVYEGESQTVFQKRSLRARTGEAISLTSAGGVSRFDTERKTPLMQWSATQSFELFAMGAPFMTNWQGAAQGSQAVHKVFGTRADRRIRPRERAASTIDMRQSAGEVDAETRRKQQQEEEKRRQQQQQQ